MATPPLARLICCGLLAGAALHAPAGAQTQDADVVVSVTTDVFGNAVPLLLAGSPLDVRVGFTGTPPETAALYVRPTGQSGGFTTIPGTRDPADERVFTAQVNGGLIRIGGLDAYVSYVEDGVPSMFPAEDPAANPLRLPVAVREMPAAVSLTAREYAMLAVPLDFAEELEDYGLGGSGAVEDVFGDEAGYGGPNASRWRILRWDPAAGSYREGAAGIGEIAPGVGFWLISATGGGFDVEGGMTPGFATDANGVPVVAPVEVPLAPGCNQVGNPFAYAVAWDAVRGSEVDGIGEPQAYDGSPYRRVEVLEPWTAYFVCNDSGAPATLSFQPGVVAAQRTSRPFAERHLERMGEGAFLLRLRAAVPGTRFRDADTFLGVSPAGRAGRDALDRSKAPPPEGGLGLRVSEGGDEVAVSVRPPEGQVWELTLEVGPEVVGRRVRVALEEHGARPAGAELFVQDRASGAPLDVRDGAFSLVPTATTTPLRVLLGTPAFAAAQAAGVALWPEAPALGVPYPNPAAVEGAVRVPYRVGQPGPVTLTVYDVLGRAVRRFDREATAAGWDEVVWGGEADRGQPLGPGLYVVVLRAPGGTQAQKLTLVR